DLKADASYKLSKMISRQIDSIRACQQRYPDAQCAYWGGGASFGAREATADAAGGEAPSAPSAGPAGAKDDSASSYSETNTQVKGVDEADIVKNDGKNIYVLHGRAFKVL